MTSLVQAEQRLPDGSTLWADFDSFLATPSKSLETFGYFFGITLDPVAAEQLARHPLMRLYSKATDYEFGAEQRASLLAEARREHKEAIAEGLSWLEEAARAVPAIARCLDVAAAQESRR